MNVDGPIWAIVALLKIAALLLPILTMDMRASLPSLWMALLALGTAIGSVGGVIIFTVDLDEKLPKFPQVLRQRLGLSEQEGQASEQRADSVELAKTMTELQEAIERHAMLMRDLEEDLDPDDDPTKPRTPGGGKIDGRQRRVHAGKRPLLTLIKGGKTGTIDMLGWLVGLAVGTKSSAVDRQVAAVEAMLAKLRHASVEAQCAAGVGGITPLADSLADIERDLARMPNGPTAIRRDAIPARRKSAWADDGRVVNASIASSSDDGVAATLMAWADRTAEIVRVGIRNALPASGTWHAARLVFDPV